MEVHDGWVVHAGLNSNTVYYNVLLALARARNARSGHAAWRLLTPEAVDDQQGPEGSGNET